MLHKLQHYRGSHCGSSDYGYGVDLGRVGLMHLDWTKGDVTSVTRFA